MKLITRNTDYALRAICFIAKGKGKLVAVDELVKALGVPRPFLRKLVQLLNRKKILRSYRGQGGGFALARPPEKIFLLELLGIFQGDLHLNECFLRKSVCPNIKTCVLHKKIDKIEKYVISELRGINIARLLKGEI